jgi:signal transduction histidine kinase
MHTDVDGALVTREATHTDDGSGTGAEPGDSRERLMAALGHELRGALQVALCWSRVLLEGESELDEPVRRGLRAIVRSTRLQQRLIEDVLDFTRMSDDCLRVELAECHLSRIAEDAASALEPRAAQLGLDFRWEVREGVRIRGDEARVEQLVGNLLDNAFKFTPRGGAVVLTVGLSRDAVELSVCDSGRGIAAELLPTIFDWRVQAEPGRRRSAGLGLGLAIAHHISSLHGGELSAESPGLGHGATFRWRVPALPCR